MNLLIDIDGTICDDIPNAEDYKFATANVIDNSVHYVNKPRRENDKPYLYRVLKP